MTKSSQWDDLRPRVLSGIAMLVVGIVAVLLGGPVFTVLTAAVCGIGVWEIARMIRADLTMDCLILGGLGAGMVLMSPFMVAPVAVAGFAITAGFGVMRLKTHSLRFVLYTMWILCAGYGFLALRLGQDVTWILWLVGIVVTTDIAGYFAGRMIGGPKFWPAISPKKTWSGTIAGWFGAIIIAAITMATTDAGAGLILISVIISFASQMGDIAQSALKRFVGIKDSSNLIPGHGGVFDRFDGMFGAAFFVMILHYVLGLLPWLGGA